MHTDHPPLVPQGSTVNTPDQQQTFGSGGRLGEDRNALDIPYDKKAGETFRRLANDIQRLPSPA